MQKVLVLLLMNVAAFCGAYAQQIRGTVTHEATGESIPAASVVVKGAKHLPIAMTGAGFSSR